MFGPCGGTRRGDDKKDRVEDLVCDYRPSSSGEHKWMKEKNKEKNKTCQLIENLYKRIEKCFILTEKRDLSNIQGSFLLSLFLTEPLKVDGETSSVLVKFPLLFLQDLSS